MEHQDNTKEDRNEIMRQKYKIGQKGNGSGHYNPVSNEYETSPRGVKMKSLEQSRSQRQIVRGRAAELAGQPQFDPVNGSRRYQMAPIASAYNMSQPVSRSDARGNLVPDS